MYSICIYIPFIFLLIDKSWPTDVLNALIRRNVTQVMSQVVLFNAR